MTKKPDHEIKTELLVHDLKIPMAVISAGAKNLLEQTDRFGELTEQQSKVLRRILRNTQAALRIVNDTLEIGRSSHGIITCSSTRVSNLFGRVLVEVLDFMNPEVSEKISETFDLNAIQRLLLPQGIYIEFGHKDWIAKVRLDENKVALIMRNLITNALKYRTEKIWISGTVASGKLLEISVRDDGNGIADSDYQKIFEAFFSSGKVLGKEIQGHGVGLTCSAMLLEHMGGEISAEPGDGCGICFTCRIPLLL